MEYILEEFEDFKVKLYNPEDGEVAKVVTFSKLAEVVCKKCSTSWNAVNSAMAAMESIKQGQAVDGTLIRMKPYWLKRV